MESIKLSEAKAHLGRYAQAAARGKKIMITDRNRPMAVLTAVDEAPRGIRPKIGLMDGRISIPEDFDAPLEDFERDFYGS